MFSKTKTRLCPSEAKAEKPSQGWHGWDDYADFYDWENAQTLDRRDVRFWQDMAQRADGPVLELGCGTGRVTIPVARTGARIVGVDRSAEMLAHARRRARRARLAEPRLAGPQRHPLAAVSQFDAVRSGDGALRHSAVARPRIRSAAPRLRRWPGAEPARRVRAGPCAGPAGVEGIPQPGQVPRPAAGNRVAHHAGGVGQAGSRDRRSRFSISNTSKRAAGSAPCADFSLVFRTLSVPQMTPAPGEAQGSA